MTLLPFSPGDRAKWLLEIVEVIAVNDDSVAVRRPGGIVRIVDRNELEAYRPRRQRRKGGGAA